MKKLILSNLVFILLFSMEGFAQSNDLLASSLDSEGSYYEDVIDTESEEYLSDYNTTKIYNVPASAVSLGMNLSSNSLNIDVNNTVKYTKAELLSKDSNETMQSLDMNENSQSVDVSKVGSGTYYLILSNDEGKVFSEKIIIL